MGIDLIVTVQFIIGPFVYLYGSCVRLFGNLRTTAEPNLEGNAVSPYETNIHGEIKQIKEQYRMLHQRLLKMREQNATIAEIHQKEIQVNRNLIEQMKSKHISP